MHIARNLNVFECFACAMFGRTNARAEAAQGGRGIRGDGAVAMHEGPAAIRGMNAPLAGIMRATHTSMQVRRNLRSSG